VFADAAAFNARVKLLESFSQQLTQAGIKNVLFESQGTAHEWLAWRRRLRELVPRLFR
jgi:S-formylglutathione hydrolase FrmB